MIDINELRQLAQVATPGPWKIVPVGDGRQKFAVADSEFLSILTVIDEGSATFGTVYDDADAKFIAAANPATINELLDRLEAAEADALEQARLNGMGSEREAALMAKLEAAEKDIAIKEEVIDSLAAVIKRLDAQCDAAEKSDAESIAMYRKARDERDALRAENAALVDDMNLLRNNNTALRSKIEAAENDDAHQKALAASALRVAEGWERKCGELRAKIEAMERQEPVGKFIRHPSNGLWEQDGYGDNPDARPLYALPGAQPKDEALWPTIANGMITPDGWKLVPIEPTPTMITAALESSHAINAHRAEYCYRAMLAAAPEAKP